MMNVEDLRIGLNLIPGVGRVLSHRILEHFPSPEAIVTAGKKEMMQIEGVGSKTASLIKAFPWQEKVAREREEARKAGGRIVTIDDPLYPHYLRNIYDPPSVLYARGELKKEERTTLGIVGSRLPSSYGKIMAEKLSSALGAIGVTVVSGFARGVDSIAHRSALESGGRTIAVLGCGLDCLYPPENGELYEEISGRGLLLSEFPMGCRPERMNFPQRNRIISGISWGTLVIEAGEKSGSLITADFASEQGREVFALPGNVTSPRSRGTNGLIKKGAKLVENIEDILEESPEEWKGLLRRGEKRLGEKLFLTEEEKRVYGLISEQEVHIDQISRSLGLPVGEASAILFRLELKGVIRQMAGQRYIGRPSGERLLWERGKGKKTF